MTKKTTGLLLSFDGVDSSGKETQTVRLVERLTRAGYVVHRFQTPDYTTPSGQDLKRRLQNKDGSWQTTPWEEKMRLFASNRMEHREEVLEALSKGEMVIYDRYVPSSITFMIIEALNAQEAGSGRQQIKETVEQEEYVTNQMPHEDLSIFLDVPPTVSQFLLEKRKQQLNEDDEYTDHLEVQNRLYNEYDILCAQDPQRIARIKCVVGDQLLGIDETAELIWTTLTSKFPQLEHHG